MKIQFDKITYFVQFNNFKKTHSIGTLLLVRMYT